MISHVVVKLVTPTMVGGARARQCDDPPTLRPPSVRGQLRFWSRAIGDRALEEDLWGHEQYGQRVRILGALSKDNYWRGGRLSKPRLARLLGPSGRHGASDVDMVPPGDEVCLRFGIPGDLELDRLRAVLWTWLHLGSVGRRSRRGYGSLQWLPSKGDIFADTDWPQLWPIYHLRDPRSLKAYLDEGLRRVCKTLGRPDEKPRRAADGDQLFTLDQVFVGRVLEGTWQASNSPRRSVGEILEQILHGLNEAGREQGCRHPEPLQLGRANPRLPSPMLWRCFARHDGRAFIPVMTWFPHEFSHSSFPQLTEAGGVYRYLNEELGFKTSLTGGMLAV